MFGLVNTRVALSSGTLLICPYTLGSGSLLRSSAYIHIGVSFGILGSCSCTALLHAVLAFMPQMP